MQAVRADNTKLGAATAAAAGIVMLDPDLAQLISAIAYAIFVVAYAWGKFKRQK